MGSRCYLVTDGEEGSAVGRHAQDVGVRGVVQFQLGDGLARLCEGVGRDGGAAVVGGYTSFEEEVSDERMGEGQTEDLVLHHGIFLGSRGVEDKQCLTVLKALAHDQQQTARDEGPGDDVERFGHEHLLPDQIAHHRSVIQLHLPQQRPREQRADLVEDGLAEGRGVQRGTRQALDDLIE